ncbi:MAG: DNA primase [Acidobacteriota bacterium]|nr:DNA primase [Pyrinomonadaceae bacterium]MDW8303757.1 DNA primase [Acidobacteriota bacterium]
MNLEFLVEEIKSRADIVKVISQYVPLKRRGSNWVGLCPFHQEKTPSFSVNPQKGLFKCFGCGKGGDVFSFLMEIEKIEFLESVKKVADIEGIPVDFNRGISEKDKKAKEVEKEKKEKILQINLYAMEFWKEKLFSKQGEQALDYLKRRGISEETIKVFGIGYAPKDWEPLLEFIRLKGFEEEIIRESGIFSVSEDGNQTYGRFRHRIIFPIFDEEGKVVAFGGRTLVGAEPKYLNSPETPVYVKSKHLYGLFQTKNHIKEHGIAILVEGYLDLLSLYQAGVRPVVASLGTAFSRDQARLLFKFARKIVVNYDGDNAGIKASEKALEALLTANDIDVKILILPGGLDPDDFIRQKGVNAYRECFKKALSLEGFLIKKVVAKPNRVDALESSLRIIKSMPNKVQKREIFDKIMLALRIRDVEHQRELWDQIKEDNASIEKIQRAVNKYLRSGLTVAEKRLLEILYHDERSRELILPKIEEGDYNKLLTAPLFRAFCILYREKGSKFSPNEVAYLVSKEDEAAKLLQMISSSKFNSEEPEEKLIEEAGKCLIKLRTMVLEDKILENSRLIMLAEESGDREKLEKLVQEQIKLNKLIVEIEKELKLI